MNISLIHYTCLGATIVNSLGLEHVVHGSWLALTPMVPFVPHSDPHKGCSISICRASE